MNVDPVTSTFSYSISCLKHLQFCFLQVIKLKFPRSRNGATRKKNAVTETSSTGKLGMLYGDIVVQLA